MASSPGSDAMDWEPDTSPNVLSAPCEPFRSSSIRKFDDFADGSEPTDRDSRLQDPVMEVDPTTIARLTVQTPMQWLGACFVFAIAVAVEGAKHRFISLFTGSATPRRRRSPRRSSPRSRFFRQNPPTAAGFASTTPLRPYKWRPMSRIPDVEERDSCIRDIPQYSQLPFASSDESEYMMSGALQPVANENIITTPRSKFVASPRSLRVRQIPGTYPQSPPEQPFSGRQMSGTYPQSPLEQPFSGRQMSGTYPQLPLEQPISGRQMSGTYPQLPLEQPISGRQMTGTYPQLPLEQPLLGRQMPGTYPQVTPGKPCSVSEVSATPQNVIPEPAISTAATLPLTTENVSLLPTDLSKDRRSAAKPPHDEHDTSVKEDAGSQTSADSSELVIYESSSVTSSEQAANIELYSYRLAQLEADEVETTLMERSPAEQIPSNHWPARPRYPRFKAMSELASIYATMVRPRTGSGSIEPSRTLPTETPALQDPEQPASTDATPLTPSCIDTRSNDFSHSQESIAPESSVIDSGLNASKWSPSSRDQGLQDRTEDLAVPDASPADIVPALLEDDGSIESNRSPSLVKVRSITEDIACTPSPSRRPPLSGLAPNKVALRRPLNLQTTPKSSLAGSRRSNLTRRRPQSSGLVGISKFSKFFSLPWLRRRSVQSIDTPEVALQTPARGRKSVAFAESPRTGRLVTNTKRYYIDEAIDHPSPSSSRDENSLMSTPSLLKSDDNTETSPPTSETRPCTPMTDEQAVSAQLFSELSQTLAQSEQQAPPLASNSLDDGVDNPNTTQQHLNTGSGSAPGSIPASHVEQQGSSNDESSQDSHNLSQCSTSDDGSSAKRSSRQPGQRSMQLENEGDDDVFVEPSEEASPNEIPLPETRTPSPDLSMAVGNLDLSATSPMNLSDRRHSTRQQVKAEEEAELKARLAKEHAVHQAQLKQEADEAAKKAGIRRMPKGKMIEPLSVHQEERVTKALNNRELTQVATTSTGVAITRRDIGKILPQPSARFDDQSGWLNDEALVAYLLMVCALANKAIGRKRSETPKCHAFNPFFYTNLETKGYEGVKRWAKKAKIGGKDLENVEYVFIPVNRGGNHWTLAVISPVRKTIEYFDSMHNSSAPVYRDIKVWLEGELGSAYKEEEWKIIEQPGFHGRGGGPSQNNAKDCGVFTVTTAKMITLGVDPMAVNAADMPTQRRRMVAEILNGGFDGDFAPGEIEFVS